MNFDALLMLGRTGHGSLKFFEGLSHGDATSWMILIGGGLLGLAITFWKNK